MHGYTAYLNGCRCDVCTAANTAASRRRRAKPITAKYVTHGISGYSQRCRCELCATAWRDYMRAYMRKRRAKLAVTAGVHNEEG
jgi:hypothetical protein